MGEEPASPRRSFRALSGGNLLAEVIQLLVLWGSIIVAAVFLASLGRLLGSGSRRASSGTPTKSHSAATPPAGQGTPESAPLPAATETRIPREEHGRRQRHGAGPPREAGSATAQPITVTLRSTSDPEISLVVEAEPGDHLEVAELIRVRAGPLVPDRLLSRSLGRYSTWTKAILKAEAVRQSHHRADERRQRWIYIRDMPGRRLLWVAEDGGNRPQIIDLREDRVANGTTVGEVQGRARPAEQGTRPGIHPDPLADLRLTAGSEADPPEHGVTRTLA